MSKKLGQHFLKNPEKIRAIIAALELRDGDTVIEVGPGHGELTGELLRYPITLYAIEKDQNLYETLVRKKWKDAKAKYCFIHEDIRNILQGGGAQFNSNKFMEVQPPYIHVPYKITGNIPYYLTGRILRLLGKLEPKPERAVITLQREVAERITAAPPKMNLLAASVQFWADPKIITYISKNDFKPRPKVDSAVVKLKTKKYESGMKKPYYELIKILFKQPRKTILNNLRVFSEIPVGTILKTTGINPAMRPQNVSIEQIKNLAREFSHSPANGTETPRRDAIL